MTSVGCHDEKLLRVGLLLAYCMFRVKERKKERETRFLPICVCVKSQPLKLERILK